MGDRSGRLLRGAVPRQCGQSPAALWAPRPMPRQEQLSQSTGFLGKCRGRSRDSVPCSSGTGYPQGSLLPTLWRDLEFVPPPFGACVSPEHMVPPAFLNMRPVHSLLFTVMHHMGVLLAVSAYTFGCIVR